MDDKNALQAMFNLAKVINIYPRNHRGVLKSRYTGLKQGCCVPAASEKTDKGKIV